MGRLDGKVALITGTAGGQGRAAAQIFAREGAHVVGCDLHIEGNRATRSSIESAGGSMLALQPVDLGDKAEVIELVERAAGEWGGLDIVYNNASSQRFGPFDDIGDEDWAYTMRNDLELVYLVTRHAWPHLVARGAGSIINVSSASAMYGSKNGGTVAHATAKGGVLGFTRALAAEGAPHNIRVNSVCPGLIETPASAKFMASDAGQEVARTMPLRRVGKPEDLAYYSLYLASEESSWVTGTNFVIDGGQTAITQ